MLYDVPCDWTLTLVVDGACMDFSLASEGTKVSMHTFHALLGLIT